MKIWIRIHGGFPALRALDERQFADAVAQRLIDMRSPATGLQIDVFGKVSAVVIEGDTVRAELDIDDGFFMRNGLAVEQVAPILAARVSKLRHPATGAMHPVSAELIQA